jgi:hypothetical protein
MSGSEAKWLIGGRKNEANRNERKRGEDGLGGRKNEANRNERKRGEDGFGRT